MKKLKLKSFLLSILMVVSLTCNSTFGTAITKDTMSSSKVAVLIHADYIAYTKTTKKSVKKEVTVYFTRTGSKYHSAGCRYLRQSCIPMKLSEARKIYDQCKVCCPPQ